MTPSKPLTFLLSVLTGCVVHPIGHQTVLPCDSTTTPAWSVLTPEDAHTVLDASWEDLAGLWATGGEVDQVDPGDLDAGSTLQIEPLHIDKAGQYDASKDHNGEASAQLDSNECFEAGGHTDSVGATGAYRLTLGDAFEFNCPGLHVGFTAGSSTPFVSTTHQVTDQSAGLPGCLPDEAAQERLAAALTDHLRAWIASNAEVPDDVVLQQVGGIRLWLTEVPGQVPLTLYLTYEPTFEPEAREPHSSYAAIAPQFSLGTFSTLRVPRADGS